MSLPVQGRQLAAEQSQVLILSGGDISKEFNSDFRCGTISNNGYVIMLLMLLSHLISSSSLFVHVASITLCILLCFKKERDIQLCLRVDLDVDLALEREVRTGPHHELQLVVGIDVEAGLVEELPWSSPGLLSLGHI